MSPITEEEEEEEAGTRVILHAIYSHIHDGVERIVICH